MQSFNQPEPEPQPTPQPHIRGQPDRPRPRSIETVGQLVPAPIALLPSPVPREAFNQVQSMSPLFNELVARLCRNGKKLSQWLQNAALGDWDFTGRLLKLHDDLMADRVAHRALGILRSDYMLHESDSSFKQVELNTIAASFGNLGTKVAELHRFILATHTGSPEPASTAESTNDLADNDVHLSGYVVDPEHTTPINSTGEKVPAAIARAHLRFCERSGIVGQFAIKVAVMMVVKAVETNAFDQRLTEYALWAKFGVRLIRRSLGDIAARGNIDNETGHLRIDGWTVSVAYFRAGYGPEDYPSDAEWVARSTIERASCYRCPTVAMQLAGTKKVQQHLARAGVLKSELGFSESEAASLLSVCTGLHNLDSSEAGEDELAAVDATVARALANRHDFVLKPQREGGGNNLYDDSLHAALTTMSREARAAYILMDRIVPPEFPAWILRAGEVSHASCVYELGVFSTFIMDHDTDELMSSEDSGYLLRTKVASVDDGGVAAGVAVLDSPYLV